MSKRRKLALLAVVCVQLAVPLGMAGLAEADLAFGDEIKLKAQPVDPLDVFRGNYVVLSYEISRLPVLDQVSRGDRVCVRLSKIGDEWIGRQASPRKPDGTAICGRARFDSAPGDNIEIEYGIETYFANAERAREIEDSMARGQLYIIVHLDDDGSARIERLETDDDK